MGGDVNDDYHVLRRRYAYRYCVRVRTQKVRISLAFLFRSEEAVNTWLLPFCFHGLKGGITYEQELD